MADRDDILSFEASASALGLAEAEMFHWVSEGRLRAYRMDPEVRFRATDVARFVRKRNATRSRKWVPLSEACELSGYDGDSLMRFMVDGAVSAYRSDRDIYFRKDEMALLRMAGDESDGPSRDAAGEPPADPDATLSLDETAAQTELSRWEVASLVDSGELTPVEPSAQMVFRRSEVEALRGHRPQESGAENAGPGDEVLRLSALVGFRFGPGGSSSDGAIRDRIRAIAKEHGLVADTLEDLITAMHELLGEAIARLAERGEEL
jgi:hypothetical protein